MTATTKLLYAGPTKEELDEKASRAKQVYGEISDFNWVWNFWSRYERRQTTWLAAVKAADKAAEYNWAMSQLEAVLKQCEVPAVREGVSTPYLNAPRNFDAIETHIFGRVLTSGIPSDRLRFWCFVELKMRGITPSDLSEERDTLKCFTATIARAEEVGKMPEDPEDPNKLRRLQNEYRFGDLKHPTYPKHMAKRIREYANLYLKAGNPKTYLSHWTGGSVTGYLAKPTAEPAYHQGQTLRYWQTYDIESYAEIPYMVRGTTPKVFQPLKIDKPVKMAVSEDAHRGDGRQLLILQVQQFVNKLPVSQRPLACLIAQRAAILDMTRYQRGKRLLDWLEQQVNDMEELLFGARVTEGVLTVRTHFWRLVGHHEVVHKLATTPSGRIFMDCARAMITEGADPTWFTKPRYDSGRGGLCDPISPDKFFYLEERHKFDYMPLASWMTIEDGVGSPDAAVISEKIEQVMIYQE